MSATAPGHCMSRRSALAYAATVASAVVLGACLDAPAAPDTPLGVNKNARYWAFMFGHDASVQVLIYPNREDAEKFDLTVRKDGKVVEFHEGLSDKTVGLIASNYLQVSYINPPTGG